MSELSHKMDKKSQRMDKDDKGSRPFYESKVAVKKLRSQQQDPAYSHNAIEEEGGSQLLVSSIDGGISNQKSNRKVNLPKAEVL